MDTGKIAAQIYEIIQSISNLGANAYNASGMLNSGVAAGIHTIINIAIKPTASMLLSFFCVLEIYRLWTKMAEHGMSGNTNAVYTISFALVKISVAVVLIRQCDGIMWAIYDLAAKIMKALTNLNITGGGSIGSIGQNQIQALLDQMNLNWFDGVWLNVQLLIPNIITTICGLIVSIMFIGRMVEIYVLVALSPLALITFANEEFSQVGKSFLKQFVAVCLQGVVMLIVLKVFAVITGAAVLGSTDVMEMTWQALQYAVLLCVCLFSAGKWAKHVAGAS